MTLQWPPEQVSPVPQSELVVHSRWYPPATAMLLSVGRPRLAPVSAPNPITIVAMFFWARAVTALIAAVSSRQLSWLGQGVAPVTQVQVLLSREPLQLGSP